MSWFSRLARRTGDTTVRADDRSKWRLTDPVRLEQECERLQESLYTIRDDAETAIAKAREEGRAEAGVAVSDLEEVARRLSALRGDLLRSVEEELRDLAVGIAARILRAELQDAPERYAEMVRTILVERGGASALEVRCHPGRHDLLRAAFTGENIEVRVVTDQTLGPWDFEVFTDYGHLDGRLERQLEEVSKRLAEQPLDLVGAGSG